MTTAINAYAVRSAGGELEPFTYDPGELGDESVEIAVEYCGICHSDQSMIDNEWHMTKYPLVPGHEVVGKITAVGPKAKKVRVGQTVGLGWCSGSCMCCGPCLGGDQNLCEHSEATIVGRHGGFADRVRCHWSWAVPLPDGVNPATAGPLFCGGLTVFNPIVQYGVSPLDRVAVVGIGGLGHMAIKFLGKWGCEVTALTSPDKEAEAREMGAYHVVNSRDDGALKKQAGRFDFVLSTAPVSLNWDLIMSTVAPKGRLHTVGVVPKPVELTVFPMLAAQKEFSASPLGSPTTLARMLDFCGRHGIEPVTETYSFEKINDALERLRSGKARYRVVLSRA